MSQNICWCSAWSMWWLVNVQSSTHILSSYNISKGWLHTGTVNDKRPLSQKYALRLAKVKKNKLKNNFSILVLFSYSSESLEIPQLLWQYNLNCNSMIKFYVINSLSAARQRGLSTSHLYIQLDPFALKLTSYSQKPLRNTRQHISYVQGGLAASVVKLTIFYSTQPVLI